MRQAGTIPNETDAAHFADYLFTLGIGAKVDRDGEAWAIWVRDEEHVARAMSELADFQSNPGDPKFASAQKEARSRREAQARREQEANRNFIDMRRRWDGQPSGPTPLTTALLVICIVVAVLTRLGGYFSSDADGVNPLLNSLGFTEEYAVVAERIATGENWHPLDAILRGEVWRLVTPIFLHFGPLHLLFNLYMLYDFGRLIESRRGSLRFGLLVIVIAILSNFGQYYFSRLIDPAYAAFGGMSGVIYGLFGYSWMKSRYEPTAEIYVHPNTVVLLMIWLVLCMLGVIGNIANWAHGVGLAVGMVIGIAPYGWRQTRRRIAQKFGGRAGKS
jgi:GlpG protein